MSTTTTIEARIAEIESILPGAHFGPSHDGTPAIEFRLAIADAELAAEYRDLIARRQVRKTFRVMNATEGRTVKSGLSQTEAHVWLDLLRKQHRDSRFTIGSDVAAQS